MDDWRTELEQVGFLEVTLPTAAARNLRADLRNRAPIVLTFASGHQVELAGVMVRWAHITPEHVSVRLEGTMRPLPGTHG